MNDLIPKEKKNLNRMQRMIHGFQIRKEEKRYTSTLKEISKVKEYKNLDIYKKPYFEVVGRRMLKENPEQTFIFGDFDNLYQANIEYGDKEKVNQFMQGILEDIVQILSENYAKDQYIICKNGDEVMIMVQDKNSEKIQKINGIMNQIKRIPLSISCGFAINQGEKFDELKENAEAEMYQNKNAKKLYNKEKYCGRTSEERAHYYLEKVLSACRINKEDLKEEGRKTLQKSVKYHVQHFDYTTEEIISKEQIKEILQETIKPKEEEKSPSIEERINKLRKEAENYYQNEEASEELVEKYIICKMLSESDDGILKREYFEKMVASKKIKYNNINALKEKEVIFIEVSGVKWINDHQGHESCDKQMLALTQQLQEIVKRSKLPGSSGLLENKFSSYYLIVDQGNQKEIEDLKDLIESLDTQFNVTCTSTPLVLKQENGRELKKQAREKNKSILEFLMDRAIFHNQKMLDDRSLQNKIKNNNESLQKNVKEFMIEILRDDIIQQYIREVVQNTGKSKEEVIENFVIGIIDQMFSGDTVTGKQKENQRENVKKIEKEPPTLPEK